MKIMSWEENVRRVEPYVPGEQPKRKDIIKLNTNECPYPPAPGVTAALERMDPASFRLYPDPDAKMLVHALAESYGLRDEQVFVGVGSDDVLAMIFLTFFQSEKPILFPDITYSFYDVWANLYRIPYEQIPVDEEFRIRFEDYRKENGGIVIANPNAPTGIAVGKKQMKDFIAEHRDVIVVVDEAYVDFGGESCVDLINEFDNLIVVQTFSKSRSMAGMRIGYAMADEKLIRYLLDVKFAMNSYTMNRPTLELGVESVRDEAYFKETTAKIVATRERMKTELEGIGFTCTDSKANFLFAAHEKIPATVMFERLKEKGIYVRYWNKPRIQNRMRITIGTDEQMDVLVKAMKEIIGEEGSFDAKVSVEWR